MKLVINQFCCWGGGFSMPNEIDSRTVFAEAKQIKENNQSVHDAVRMSPTLIKWVEDNPDNIFGVAALRIKEIPDDATDYMIEEDDGVETVIYVKNGRIHYA